MFLEDAMPLLSYKACTKCALSVSAIIAAVGIQEL